MNVNLIVDQQDLRFDQFLSTKLDSISRSKIQTSIKNGSLYLDGKQVKAGTILKGGEKITGYIISNISTISSTTGFTQRFYYILAAGCIPVRIDTYYPSERGLLSYTLLCYTLLCYTLLCYTLLCYTTIA